MGLPTLRQKAADSVVQVLSLSLELPVLICFQSTDIVKAGETTGLTGHHHPGDQSSQSSSWRSTNTHNLKGEIKGERL